MTYYGYFLRCCKPPVHGVGSRHTVRYYLTMLAIWPRPSPYPLLHRISGIHCLTSIRPDLRAEHDPPLNDKFLAKPTRHSSAQPMEIGQCTRWRVGGYSPIVRPGAVTLRYHKRKTYSGPLSRSIIFIAPISRIKLHSSNVHYLS